MYITKLIENKPIQLPPFVKLREKIMYLSLGIYIHFMKMLLVYTYSIILCLSLLIQWDEQFSLERVFKSQLFIFLWSRLVKISTH